MTSNFYVLVSDQPLVSNDLATARAQAGVSSYYVPGYSGTPGTINVNRTGRYVRVQLAASQYLVLAEVKVFQATGSTPIPTDGIGTLAYDVTNNHITTAGFAYDAAGNQVRALMAGSSASQRFRYDAANRLVQVLTDDTWNVLATYTYGVSNERLISEEWGLRTYYVSEGGATIAEYFESGSSTTPQWSKSYVYLGARLLSTLTPNGSGGEAIQFHHPDRLGTRLVTDPASGTSFEQVSLPFGTPLNAESTGSTNRRFTSYDRSPTTGLDYAVNRHYDSQQGRFTQVDPIGMSAASLENPQTLNLYSYCGNDPINQIDPDGLFWGKLFKWIGKLIKILSIVALVVITVIIFAPASSFIFKAALWTLFHVLLPLSHIPVLGALVPLGTFGSPQWNPNSRSVLGNSFQGQDKIYTCQHPPDCQDEIPPLSFSVPDIIGHRSFWEKLDNALDKGLTIVVGFAGTITFGGSKWAGKKFATVLGGQAAAREWERDNSVREGSWFHTGGEAIGYVWDIATGEQIAVAAGRGLRLAGRIGLDYKPHLFARLGGRWSHLQLDLWRAGIKNSDFLHARIPLFTRLSKRWKWERKFKF